MGVFGFSGLSNITTASVASIKNQNFLLLSLNTFLHWTIYSVLLEDVFGPNKSSLAMAGLVRMMVFFTVDIAVATEYFRPRTRLRDTDLNHGLRASQPGEVV